MHCICPVMDLADTASQDQASAYHGHRLECSTECRVPPAMRTDPCKLMDKHGNASRRLSGNASSSNLLRRFGTTEIPETSEKTANIGKNTFKHRQKPPGREREAVEQRLEKCAEHRTKNSSRSNHGRSPFHWFTESCKTTMQITLRHETPPQGSLCDLTRTGTRQPGKTRTSSAS